jgi:Mrp family chromosome partitioning ATPase
LPNYLTLVDSRTQTYNHTFDVFTDRPTVKDVLNFAWPYLVRNTRNSLDQPTYTSMPTILSVASGKGGAGKSMVASNLGLMLAKRGYRTTLVD